jgi:hypothetical protein
MRLVDVLDRTMDEGCSSGRLEFPDLGARLRRCHMLIVADQETMIAMANKGTLEQAQLSFSRLIFVRHLLIKENGGKA